MWINPKPELATNYPDSFLLDKKYVSHTDYQLILGEADRLGARALRAVLGFGEDSSTWRSNPLRLEPGQWHHVAFTYALMETLRDPKGDVFPPPAGDGGYDATELKGGIEYRVKSLTRDRQRPFIFVPPTMAPAPLLQVIAE